MPYTGSEFSVADTGESEIYGFDFVNELQHGETIASAQWAIIDTLSIDLAPASRATGAIMVEGSVVSQRLTGLTAGGRYLLKAQVVTSLGNTLSLWSYARAQAPA